MFFLSFWEKKYFLAKKVYLLVCHKVFYPVISIQITFHLFKQKSEKDKSCSYLLFQYNIKKFFFSVIWHIFQFSIICFESSLNLKKIEQ